MTDKIRLVLFKRGMTVTELAKILGCTSQNLSIKLKRDNFTERDLCKIADALGCRFEGRFMDVETGEEIR